MLQTESEAKVVEHNSLAKYCYDYMHLILFSSFLSMDIAHPCVDKVSRP